MPQLTVHNAELKTATVEIRTLTISGKQVTLAVFRQLQEAELIAEDGTFNGLPWGRVNYHPDKVARGGKWVGCGDQVARRHLHVVWQQGDELRRDRVERPSLVGDYWLDETDAYAQALYCASGHSDHEFAPSGRAVSFMVDGARCMAAAFSHHQITGECGSGPDLPALRAAIAAEQERRARRRARWAELLDLPQLFIAV